MSGLFNADRLQNHLIGKVTEFAIFALGSLIIIAVLEARQ
jgi:hypothetical protein